MSALHINAQELSISLFYDSSYVDVKEDPTGEAFTLRNFLESINYTVHTFEGIDANSVTEGLTCHEVLFLPESESGDFAGNINSSGGGDVIRDYVNSGGLVFVIGSDGVNQSSSNSAENLNALFNFSIDNSAYTSSGFTYLNENANISFLGALPDSIRSFTTTNFIRSLPVDAEILYELEPDKASVVQMPYGDGNIVFLGWSFFNAGPSGNQGPDRWSNLIQLIIAEWSDQTQFPDCSSCDTRPPDKIIGSNTITRYLDADGNTGFNESDFEGNYDDNCGDFTISLISSETLNCVDSYVQEYYLEVRDEVGNSLLDTYEVTLIDTIMPEFSFFPDDVTIECGYDEEAQMLDSMELLINVNEILDLDSLDFVTYDILTDIVPTGSELAYVEFFVEGEFNDLGELWVRVIDGFSNSCLLYDGICDDEEDMSVWFSRLGEDPDCSLIGANTVKFRAKNRNLNVFEVGTISPKFTFEVLSLGSLEGQVRTLGVKLFFRSDLTFPNVQEACNYDLTYTDDDNRTNCPIGVIIRTWEATDESGNVNRRNQIILVDDSQDVEITYPNDYVVDCASGVNYLDSLLPEHLPDGFNEPIVFDDCRDYQASYSDQVISSCGLHNIEIERTWIVQSDCEPGIQYQHRQNLKIIDDEAPIIDTVEPYIVFVDEATCLSGGNFYFPSVDDLMITDCSENLNIDMRVIDSMGLQFREDELMAGTYFVEIKVVDPCGNEGIRLVPVELIDVSPPEIVCSNQILEVPINQLGDAQICGSILLSSVNENCSIARYQMSYNPSFNEDDGCLEIDCDDLGLRTVYVRAEDVSGNSDVCSARIRVVDREAPRLLCSDIILPCNAPFDPSNYPLPQAVDNCDNNPYVECLEFRFIGNACDSTYFRECFTRDAEGNRSLNCEQYLTRIDTFSTNVIWPEDVVELNCGGDIDPSYTGEPIIQASCGSYASTYSDNQFSLCGASNLFGVDRRWTVRNTCTNESFRFDQQILVTDLDPPKFVFPADQIFEIEIADFNCETLVNIIPEAIDSCTNDIIYSNSITGSVRELSGTFDIGDHEVTFYAEDLCGNIDSLEVTIRVTENKNPFVACQSGLNFFLNQAEFVDVFPPDVLDTVFDLCSPNEDIDFFISKVLPNGQDIGRQPKIRFECRDLGLNLVRLFARDASNNISSCDVQVNVIDTFRLCPNGDFYDISGMIFNENRIVVGGATAYINNNPLVGFGNGNNGDYLARALPKDADYEIAIQKDFDDDNGVTALDLALIQQSQLRLRELGSPYKIIAADVTNDQKISVLDMIRIRALLLGVTDEFPDVPSWRFIPEDFEFVNPLSPFENPIYYADTVFLGGESIRDLNFIGIKMGDVNNSAELFVQGNRNVNRSENIKFDIRYAMLGSERIKLTIDLPKDWISGQLYLELADELINNAEWRLEGMNKDLYYFEGNHLHFVWNQYQELNLNSLSFIVESTSIEDLILGMQLREDKRSLGAISFWQESDIELNYIREDNLEVAEDQCLVVVPTLWTDGFRIVDPCSSHELKSLRVFDSNGYLHEELDITSLPYGEYRNNRLQSGFYLIEIQSLNGDIFHFKTIKAQ